MPERARSRRSGVTGSPGYGVAAGLRAQGRVDSCSVADDLHFHFHLTFRKVVPRHPDMSAGFSSSPSSNSDRTDSTLPVGESARSSHGATQP